MEILLLSFLLTFLQSAALLTPFPPKHQTALRAISIDDSIPIDQREEGLKGLIKNQRRKLNPKPPIWEKLSQKAKDDVKAWFIERGNQKGVPFGPTIDFVKSHSSELEQNFVTLTNDQIHPHNYKSYYTQTFHGYETGNLSWEAAEDCLGATLSMSLSYWPKNKPMETADWFRSNFTSAIQDFHQGKCTKMLDVAGSVGVSTKVLLDDFPSAQNIGLVDLSPFFLSTAKMLLETPGSHLYSENSDRVDYHHSYAEDLPYADNSQDAVTISFLIHELPEDITARVIREAWRVLRPGGTLAILDLDAATIQALPPIRRFLFEVSEPHIAAYKKVDPCRLMGEAGFNSVSYCKNDPMNARWLARKPNMMP